MHQPNQASRRRNNGCEEPMKTLLSVCAALAITLGTASARAVDVTGAWSADMRLPDGRSYQRAFTFKQDGAALTGTVQGPQGDPIAISNGKIDGDRFSFEFSWAGVAQYCNGWILSDEIKMKIEYNGPVPGISRGTLHRVKPTPPAPSGFNTPAKPAAAVMQQAASRQISPTPAP
jgi:hypothetical protein